MKYWQNFKSQMDVTANHLLAAGTPGYTSVTLICLIILATLFKNFSQRFSHHRFYHGESNQED
jgi:hypothetical protein